MKYVIIGASAAAISAVENLRALDSEGEIIMVSEDSNVYSRCMLHHYVSNRRNLEGLSFINEDFFEKNNVNWIKGKKVVKVVPENKVIILNDGQEICYDKLLIASGASATVPPITNLREGKNVNTLRDINDAVSINEFASKCKNAAVIGAGLVGMDAVVGLQERGVHVSVMEMGDRILPLQLDKDAAKAYEDVMKEKNIDIYTNVKVVSVNLDENSNATGINLEDGRCIPCDFVVVAAGVRANVEFLEGSGIEVNRGVVINEKLETSQKDIYAAGDVCGTGIWPIAVKQARYAAYNMVGKEERVFDDYFAFKNTLNFFGIKTVSIGNVQENDDVNVDIIKNKKIYKKILHKDGIVQGILFQGDISYCGVWTEVIKRKLNISDINKDIFDINYGDFFGIDEKGKFSYNV